MFLYCFYCYFYFVSYICRVGFSPIKSRINRHSIKIQNHQNKASKKCDAAAAFSLIFTVSSNPHRVQKFSNPICHWSFSQRLQECNSGFCVYVCDLFLFYLVCQGRTGDEKRGVVAMVEEWLFSKLTVIICCWRLDVDRTVRNVSKQSFFYESNLSPSGVIDEQCGV